MDAEDPLYQALVKADRSEQLTAVVRGLARELNETLAKTVGGIALARANDERNPTLAGAEIAALEARDIARRLMALGQSDAAAGTGARAGGGVGAPPGAVPVRALLEEVARTGGAGAGAVIAIRVPEGTPPASGDRAALTQAFQALLRNALEAAPAPPGRAKVQLNAMAAQLGEGQVAELPAGDYLEFEVRDNGGGIAAADLERMWEPFFTTKKHAAGLGLPTALAIVRRFGGQIGVDTEVGVGTVFTVFLPRYRAPEYAGGHPGAATRFRSGRVLVMEHEEGMRSVAAGLLEKLGYTCDVARDGEEAVALYRRYWDVGRPHDAVLLDGRTPGGMTAEEAHARLKEFDPDVRVVLCGPDDPEGLKLRAEATGFAGWLAKPYRIAELAEALQTVIA